MSGTADPQWEEWEKSGNDRVLTSSAQRVHITEADSSETIVLRLADLRKEMEKEGGSKKEVVSFP